jgi:hypothetical protein
LCLYVQGQAAKHSSWTAWSRRWRHCAPS